MKITKKELLSIIKEEALKLKEQIEKVEDTTKVDMTKFDSLKSSSDTDKALVYKNTEKNLTKKGPQTKELGGYDEKGIEDMNTQDKDQGSDKDAATAVKVDAGKEKKGTSLIAGQHTAEFTSKTENPKMDVSKPFNDKKFDGKMNTQDKDNDEGTKTFVDAGEKKGGKTHTAGQAKAMPKEKAPVVKDKAPIADGIEVGGSNVDKKTIKESYTKKELIDFIKSEAKKIVLKENVDCEKKTINENNFKDEQKFGEELASILTQYKEGSEDEPLDGDEVDILVEILRAKLNLIEGNITHEEYMNMNF